MGKIAFPLLMSALALPLSCGKRTSLISPVVRADLRHTLTEIVGRALDKDGQTRTCKKTFTVQAGPASQTFEASWRVFEHGGTVYITAVELTPSGPTVGGQNPEASASTGDVTVAQAGKLRAASLPLSLTYTAQSGCTRAEARKTITLSATDPGCPKPPPKLKLLTPVD